MWISPLKEISLVFATEFVRPFDGKQKRYLKIITVGKNEGNRKRLFRRQNGLTKRPTHERYFQNNIGFLYITPNVKKSHTKRGEKDLLIIPSTQSRMSHILNLKQFIVGEPLRKSHCCCCLCCFLNRKKTISYRYLFYLPDLLTYRNHIGTLSILKEILF